MPRLIEGAQRDIPRILPLADERDVPPPARSDSFPALGADAGDLGQALRHALDDVKDLLAEGLYELGGEVRPDSLQRGGRRDPDEFGLELLAVLSVDDPSSPCFDEFARDAPG